MKKVILTTVISAALLSVEAQTNPAITSWLQNTTTTGSHYIDGNSTVISDTDLANVQLVEYSTDWVYVSTEGVPTYTTGPFLDGNPSLTTAQDVIYKIPLVPIVNTGAAVSTGLGNIGIFIDGTSIFDFQDGVSYSNTSGQDAGGPGGGMGDGVWNRDAIVAEQDGFDCSKGHPAGGNYHHHQNPSAFKLDLNVLSTICNLYDADGLYAIDATVHSPLIGFAYDGYPIYGAYGYADVDGTGGITRIKSGYSLRSITVRTHYADGSNVTDGPNVSAGFPIGHYKEDYEFISSNDTDVLDEHNGRFCVTPEYPNGTYAYFATVDANWNSEFPYVVGSSYYGVVQSQTVNSVNETVETYAATNGVDDDFINELNFSIFPNPTKEFIAVQANGLVKQDINLKLYDLSGKLVTESNILQGSTIWYLDVRTVYNGQYILRISSGNIVKTKKISVNK
jgi:hypothetical protein